MQGFGFKVLISSLKIILTQQVYIVEMQLKAWCMILDILCTGPYALQEEISETDNQKRNGTLTENKPFIGLFVM